MAFAVESDGRKFVYSGDAGPCDALSELCRNADLLLHWCYRLDGEAAHPLMLPLTPTPSQIAQMARQVGVRRLLLTHFRIHMDAPERHAAALAALRDSFGANSSIVSDLETYDI